MLRMKTLEIEGGWKIGKKRKLFENKRRKKNLSRTFSFSYIYIQKLKIERIFLATFLYIHCIVQFIHVEK